MRKKISKALFITLAVMMLLTLVGLSTSLAATEGDYYYSVENGKATITSVDMDISGDVVIPAKLGGYPVTSIGEAAFIDCQYIESIQLPKSLKNIDPWAFAGCLNLKRITIPNSVTNIGSWAFAGCISLESIIIPDAVTNIPEYTFSLCLNLNSITLPASITYIEENAFDDCENLEDVYYTGTKAQWQKIDIDSYNDYLTSATIHYNHCDHKYSNSCDKTCNICGATRTITHTYKTTTTKATLTANGKTKTVCTVCGYVKTNKVLYSPKTFTLSATSLTYNGYVRTPTVTVKDSAGNVLKKDTDYTVTYASGRKNVGTYKVTVKMIGNYTGTKTLSFKIKPIDISTCKVKLSATSVTYNGKVRTPSVTVTNAYSTKLTKDKHYTVTYASGRKNAGTYKVTVKMIGNYTGTKTLSFKINPMDISKCTVKLSATSVTYNGNVRTPTVTITNANGAKLTKDTHYTVKYATGRKNVGTYNVTVKMKGNYTGSKTLAFTIKPTIKTSANLFVGDTLKIGAKSNTKITYKSSDTSIAKVSTSGVITAVKAGTVTITVTSNKISQKITVKVSKPSITLNKKSANIGLYDSLTLKATANPSTATVKWTSSNTAVAKVSSKGKITPVKTGTCTITASITYNGKTYKATCSVKIVSQQPITITAVEWETNFLDGVSPTITIRNNTNKDIKYIELETEYRNKYGDPAYCDIWDDYRCTLTINEGIDAKKSDSFYGDSVIYNNSVHRIDVKKITITFVDNTVATVNYNKYWVDSEYYYQ